MPRQDNPNYYRDALARLREEFGGRCQAHRVWAGEHCEARKGLEFAHLEETPLWGRGRGQGRRVHDIRKNRGRYIILCRRHHLRQETLAGKHRRQAEAPREREPGEEG